MTKLSVKGHPLSPVKHLYLREQHSRAEESALLDKVVLGCQSEGLCIVRAQYLEEKERKCPRASIRITANRMLTASDLEDATKTIERVSMRVL